MTISDSDYQDALLQISEYLQTLGIEIIAEIDEERGDTSIDGFLVDAGGREIAITGTPSLEYFRAEIEYDVRGECVEINEVEKRLQERGINRDEEVRAALEDGIEIDLDDITHEDFIEAAEESISQINHDELQHTLISHLAEGENVFNLYNDQGIVFGFSISRRIFVYENSFTISKFNSELQEIVNSSIIPHNLLADVYNLGSINVDTGDDRGISPSDDPAFR